MNPYIAPGIPNLTEDKLIEIISDTFNMPDDSWVKGRRTAENAVARQVLLYCLFEIMRYPLKAAAEFVGKSHCTVVYARKVVRETLMYDRYYGGKVRRIIQQAENMMKR